MEEIFYTFFFLFAFVYEKIFSSGWTALMFAAAQRNGGLSVVKLLVENGAALDIQNRKVCVCAYCLTFFVFLCV